MFPWRAWPAVFFAWIPAFAGMTITLALGNLLALFDDIATILDQSGVCVRAGHHCAQPLMRRMHVPATARASVYVYSTQADIDALIDGVERVKEVFG